MSAAKTLLLRANGTAELLDAHENQLWASDSDEDFQDEWAGTMFLNESDVEALLEYLVEHGQLTDREAQELEIEEESFAGDGDDSDEDLEEEEDA